MKKLASLILAVIMVLSMTIAAFADEQYTITVQPQDKTNVSLAGNTYYAYKVFDVTYDTERKAYAYTVAEEFINFEYDGKSGKELISFVESMKDNSDALNAFAESALIYAKSNKINCIAKKAETESVTIDVKEPGYYLVAGSATAEGDQTVIAACALSTVAPSTTVNVKADAPSLEKKIIENDKAVDANNAAIGDTVHYQITSKVPNRSEEHTSELQSH